MSNNNRINLDMFAGDDRTFSLVARGAARELVNLAGYSLAFRAARRAGDTAILSKAGTITGASSGAYSVALAPDDTDEMEGDYEYDVLATSGAGAKLTVTTGRLRVRARNAAS